MAIKLIANYSKRLGLPGYSSHQFSVSVETELVNVDDVAGESQRLYDQLQSNVDRQITRTGFVPPHDYGMEDEETGSTHARNGVDSNGSGPSNSRWRCSPKQQELILRLVDEHELALHEVDHLARQRFGKGVTRLNKMEASGLIDELLDTHGGGNGSNRNGQRGNRRSAYSGNGRGGGR